MIVARMLLAIVMLAPYGLGVSDAIASEDACCADEAPADTDPCPCSEGCDEDCVCCGRAAADVAAGTWGSILASRAVRYESRIDPPPRSVDVEGREPVPRYV